ncbi:MerR family transcriptional regulator [Streptomyces sp. NPDC047014]|uniref:MerR family transcriptional regulator n=1 Tax=Streptomyces sp. NPDC047014 TaxID=3155736 RepID=UPI0033C11369
MFTIGDFAKHGRVSVRMLRLRQAELEAALAAAAARLVQVEARLRTIESEGTMPADDIVVKSLPPVRVARLTGTAASFEPADITGVIVPLYEELCRRFEEAGISPAGPGLSHYEDAPGAEPGTAVLVHAALPVAGPVRAAQLGGAVEIVTLPAVERAATVVHRGAMDGVLPTAQALARWIDAHGHRSAGYARELTLACPEDPAQWVTELQEPLVGAG